MIDVQDAIVPADMRLAGAALKTLAAGHVRFRRHIVADLDAGHIRADLAAHFVADDARRVYAAMRPGIPVVDVRIGAAERRGFHFHNDIAGPGGGVGTGHRCQAGPGGGLHECAHTRILAQLCYGGTCSPKKRVALDHGAE